MVGAEDVLLSGGGVATGLGSTILIRDQFDAANETSLFRPSVLWGVGTGLLGMGAPMFLMDRPPRGAVGQFVEDYSAAALAGGLFSAFSPKGSSSLTIPTV